MKIICKDNFGREHVADQLVAENLNEYWAKRITSALNDKLHTHSQEWFDWVEDDYVLWRGMEELV